MAGVPEGHVKDAHSRENPPNIPNDWAPWGQRARAAACGVNWRILKDDESPLHFARASQNIDATAALLEGLLKQATREGRCTHQKLRMLIERAEQQQAESSMSQQREQNTGPHPPARQSVKDVSVHQAPHVGKGPANAPVRGCLGADSDARHTINAWRHGHKDEQAVMSRGYYPQRGRQHDNSEDRSPSPDSPGPRVFYVSIRSAPFPARYRPQQTSLGTPGR
jgi:hypothetical protein